jgi:hypothetical protein
LFAQFGIASLKCCEPKPGAGLGSFSFTNRRGRGEKISGKILGSMMKTLAIAQ